MKEKAELVKISAADFISESTRSGIELSGYIAYSPQHVDHILFGFSSCDCPNIPIHQDFIEEIEKYESYECVGNDPEVFKSWSANIILKPAGTPEGKLLQNLLIQIKSQQPKRSSSSCSPGGCNCSGKDSSSSCEPPLTVAVPPPSQDANTATRICYSRCPAGWLPTGSCCRTWYYDADGNRVCTSYGSTCAPLASSPQEDDCGQTRLPCTPWGNPCDDFSSSYCMCQQYRDCGTSPLNARREWRGHNCGNSRCKNYHRCQ